MKYALIRMETDSLKVGRITREKGGGFLICRFLKPRAEVALFQELPEREVAPIAVLATWEDECPGGDMIFDYAVALRRLVRAWAKHLEAERQRGSDDVRIEDLTLQIRAMAEIMEQAASSIHLRENHSSESPEDCSSPACQKLIKYSVSRGDGSLKVCPDCNGYRGNHAEGCKSHQGAEGP